jgi:hypothetical protein
MDILFGSAKTGAETWQDREIRFDISLVELDFGKGEGLVDQLVGAL